jgi:hypothetical protein
MPGASGVAHRDARIAHYAAVTIAASPVPTNMPSVRLVEASCFGLLCLVSDARGRDHGSMSSTTTVSRYEQACSRYCWELSGGYKVEAYVCASSYSTGRVWVVNGDQEL